MASHVDGTKNYKYSSVSIVTGYRARVQFLMGKSFFLSLSLLHSLLSSGCWWSEADHSPPSNVKVKNGGAILPLPHTPLWHGT
jgi:hypothetical protein